jgi:hypothetical protein
VPGNKRRLEKRPKENKSTNFTFDNFCRRLEREKERLQREKDREEEELKREKEKEEREDAARQRKLERYLTVDC